MGRIIADEAELLTLAVMPQTRRTGIGTQLMQAFEAQLSKAKVQDVFLEVSCENAPAIALYQRFGYVQTGLRKAYYNTPDGRKIDAIVMGKSIF
ncbi:UNVERIFIED_CONTAM: hypothetical protein GTU68_062470 [Idotea baltica]|nr:hypothetical protein [Idotea baltica]